MNLEENLTIEFKSEYTENIKKEIIAFANTNGGTLYIGVDDTGNPIGLINPDDVLLKVSNTVRDSIKPDVTMFINYQTEIIEEKRVLKITVQRGTQRPYYLIKKGLRPEGVYVRQGSSSVPASESKIVSMIKETDGDVFEDVRSLNQNLTFNSALKDFKERNIAFGENQKITLGLMTTDKVYTNVGFLLSDQCTHSIKAAIFEGTTKTTFKDRQEFSGSVLKQLNDAYEYIKKSNKIRSEFEGLRRIDMFDYPENALREALINNIVHRNYSFSGSILISIFDDRIELLSIGGLMKGISLNDVVMGVSICRNPKLAHIFYRLELIEAFGTGVPKIFDSYKEFEVPSPKIDISDNAFKVTLYNTNYTKSVFNQIDDVEYKILALFEDKEYIVRKDIQEHLLVSQTLAGKKLKNLISKKLIKSVGNGKNTKYKKI